MRLALLVCRFYKGVKQLALLSFPAARASERLVLSQQNAGWREKFHDGVTQEIASVSQTYPVV